MSVNFYIILIGIAVVIFLLFLIPFFIGFRGTDEAPADAGIFKSLDGGESWKLAVRSSEALSPLPAGILSFAFHPGDPRVIYLGMKGGGLWVTKNAGETWAPIIDAKDALRSNSEIYSISIARSRPAVIYLAVFQENKGRLFRTVDGGITFDEMYAVPIERFGVFGVSVHPANPNHVVIATGQGGFLESKDGGVTWRVQKWFPDGLVRLLDNPGNAEELFVMTRGGELYRSQNRGLSWARLTGAYSHFDGATQIADIQIDPNQNATVYTASKFGLLRSVNSGNAWDPVNLIIPPEALPIRSVAVNPGDSRRVYAGVGSTIYFSEDGGERWRVLDLPTTLPIRMIRIDPENPRTIYVVAGR